jgi:hypothetical protein
MFIRYVHLLPSTPAIYGHLWSLSHFEFSEPQVLSAISVPLPPSALRGAIYPSLAAASTIPVPAPPLPPPIASHSPLQPNSALDASMFHFPSDFCPIRTCRFVSVILPYMVHGCEHCVVSAAIFRPFPQRFLWL